GTKGQHYQRQFHRKLQVIPQRHISDLHKKAGGAGDLAITGQTPHSTTIPRTIKRRSEDSLNSIRF
ncbi:hypothetical protein, partial [Profundibacter sp.]